MNILKTLQSLTAGGSPAQDGAPQPPENAYAENAHADFPPAASSSAADTSPSSPSSSARRDRSKGTADSTAGNLFAGVLERHERISNRLRRSVDK